MAIILKPNEFEKVNSKNSNFIDSSLFDVFKSERTSNEVIAIILTESGKRIRLSKIILEMLGNPTFIEISMEDSTLVISDSHLINTLDVKPSRVIYSTKLANRIIGMNPNIDFGTSGSTPMRIHKSFPGH